MAKFTRQVSNMKQYIRRGFILTISMLMFYNIPVPIQPKCEQFPEKSYVKPQNKVVIGSVYCRPDKVNILKDKYFDYTIVMLKSALISAHLYNISILEIHLFLEHIEDESYFQERLLKDMVVPNVTVNFQMHSAVDKVPKKFQDHMIYHRRFRCGYVRFYFPQVLADLDSIIYLDIDMIVTGNLMEHWNLLAEMDPKQLIAVGRDSPVENEEYRQSYKAFFTNAPHVPPRGINSGLLIMNLTRMREFKMSEKITRIYEDYFKVTNELSDQVVLNILLYYNPGLMLLMPCKFNFMGPECENKAFYCQLALEDQDGIHSVHGNTKRLMYGRVFHSIYKFYKEFNISTLPGSAIVTDLMQPIKKAYSNELGNNKMQCSGTLDKALFKRFVHSK